MSIADVAVSPQVFRPLQKEVAKVLNSVLAHAAQLSGSSSVQRAHIEQALREVIASGTLTGKQTEKKVDPDDYAWLDRQLDPLRSRVIGVASHLADTDGDPEVTPGLVRRVWNSIWSSESQRSAAFQRDLD